MNISWHWLNSTKSITWKRNEVMPLLNRSIYVNTSYNGYAIIYSTYHLLLNTLKPRQNGPLFEDDIFTCISLNENIQTLIKNSLKFVLKGPIGNSPALVQIMAWRRPGDKPLSEPMVVNLLTHICITRPQWVNHEGMIYMTVILNALKLIYYVTILQTVNKGCTSGCYHFQDNL